MVDLRARVEADLAFTLEGDFGMSITFTSPNTGLTQTLKGQVIYYSTEVDPTTGAQIRIEKPSVTVRRSSLTEVPGKGESWGITIPTTPRVGAPTETYITEIADQDGNSFGFITYFLTKAIQS